MDRTGPQDQKVAVIWTRVSTKEQADNNLSLETQEKACRDYAERNGIEIDCIRAIPTRVPKRRENSSGK